MPHSVSAEFDTRRDAEMAVEHIVQEYGIDRKAVTVVAASPDNSARTRVAGSDVEINGDKAHIEGRPALAGRVRVSVEVGGASADKVVSSFATYNGTRVD